MHEDTSDCYDTNKIQTNTTVLRMDWMARRIRSGKRAERLKRQSQATFIPGHQHAKDRSRLALQAPSTGALGPSDKLKTAS